jgi:hypothetical protein
MPEKLSIPVRIVGRKLPGQRFGERQDVYVGVQRGREVVERVPVTHADVQFDLTLDLVVGEDGGADDFRGPYVHGTRGARFLYLSWGQLSEDGAFAMFGRVKLPLPALDADALTRLRAGDTPLTAIAELSDARGRPVTAALHASQLVWEW